MQKGPRFPESIKIQIPRVHNNLNDQSSEIYQRITTTKFTYFSKELKSRKIYRNLKLWVYSAIIKRIRLQVQDIEGFDNGGISDQRTNAWERKTNNELRTEID